jgi:hypothetical protein
MSQWMILMIRTISAVALSSNAFVALSSLFA